MLGDSVVCPSALALTFLTISSTIPPAKKSLLEKDYNSRLSAIERSIQEEIQKKAKKDNYDYVFAKSVLLYGGKDITDEIHLK